MIEYLTEYGPDILEGVVAMIGGFAIIATATPNKADNKIADVLLRIVNFFGMNFGRSRNDPNA